MSLHIYLLHGQYVNHISAYALTLPSTDAFKEEFYKELTKVIDGIIRHGVK